MAKMTLEELVAQLDKAYGTELRAVVLYGSAAAGEMIPKRSDYNVLVIVDRLGVEQLRAAAAATRAWGDAGNPPPMTLTTDEWRRSADIFPMEYADILERHRVLKGDPPFAGVQVDPEHLRLELEQQTMGKLLQLRRGVLDTGNDGRLARELLEASLSTMMILFRAVLRLHKETPPTDYEALSLSVARHAGFDADPFVRVVRHVRGQTKLAKEEAGAVLAAYLTGVERLVAHLDRLHKQAH